MMTALRALRGAQERKKIMEMTVRRMSVLFLLVSLRIIPLLRLTVFIFSVEMWKALATMM